MHAAPLRSLSLGRPEKISRDIALAMNGQGQFPLIGPRRARERCKAGNRRLWRVRRQLLLSHLFAAANGRDHPFLDASPDFILRNSQNATSQEEKDWRNWYMGHPSAKRARRCGRRRRQSTAITTVAVAAAVAAAGGGGGGDNSGGGLNVMAVQEQLEPGRPQGDPKGGNVVLINCTGLTGNGVPKVMFGKVEATDVQILPPGVQMPGGICQLSVITPPKPPGGSLSVDVTVHDGDGRSDVKKKGFEYRTRGSKRKQRVDPAVADDPELIALMNEPIDPLQLQEVLDQEEDPMRISFEALLQGIGDAACSAIQILVC